MIARAPTGSTRRRSTRPRGSTCARTRPSSRLLDELDGWRELGGERDPRGGRLGARATRRSGSRAGEAGRVAVLDLLRARTRRFEVVFVLGLEEGRLPRARAELAVPRRRAEGRARALVARGRLLRTDPVARDRYLFYTACTRPTRRLYLVREAATDDGAPREPSPFWDEARAALRARRRRALDAAPAARRADLAARGRAERARAAARARGARARRPRPRRPRSRARTAGSGGSTARSRAFDRPTRLTHPVVLEQLRAQDDLRRHRARALRRLLVDVVRRPRCLQPRSIDAEVDPRLQRHDRAPGAVHVLQGPAEADRRRPRAAGDARGRARLPARVPRRGARRRTCASTCPSWSETSSSRASRATSRSSSGARPSRSRRSCRAASRSRSAPSARRRSCSAGSSSAASPSRARSTASTATRSARAGSSSTTSPAAPRTRRREIERELHLQIPLYMLVLRDLVGMEPLGGVYRTLAGDARARGLLREEAREDGLQGFMQNDYVDEDTFWGGIERARGARASASSSASARATSGTTRAAARARPGASSGRRAG